MNLIAKENPAERTAKGCSPRIQAFEFGDQSWFRGVWREAYLDGMNFMLWVGGVYRRMFQPYARWARRAGGHVVLDLASGGGRPIHTLVTEARKNNVPLPRIILSDLHPDLDAYARIAAAHPDEVSFVNAPVDATAPGQPEARLFSICTAFHHFPPDRARQLIANAARNGDGIFIQEIFVRHWLSTLLSVCNLIPLMLSPFFSRRISLFKILITTVIPIIPFMLMFDGVVSVFRTYRLEEIMAMVPQELRREWRWETGSCHYLGFLGAPYVCGYRPRVGFAANPDDVESPELASESAATESAMGQTVLNHG